MHRRIAFIMATALILAVFAATSFSWTALAQGKMVKVATLDWEPYTGKNLPGYGAVSVVIAEAFKKRGYETGFGVYPWKRAIVKAWEGGDGMVGYFPGYHCSHNPDTKFEPSALIAEAPLGFVYNVNKPLKSWTALEDLKGTKIGYVNGYASTEKFEALESNKTLTVTRTNGDLNNLLMLGQGRLDAVLVDKFVFQSLMNTEDRLKKHQDELLFADKALDIKDLFLCFRQDAEGQALREEFNAGLAAVDSKAIIDEYFRKSFSK